MPRQATAAVRRPSAALALACALVLGACATVPRDATDKAWAEYAEVLRRLESRGPGLEAGSAVERDAIERFQRLLSDFKAPDFRSEIRQVYAEDLFFNDTLKTLRSAREVEEHLAATADALEQGTVEFVDLAAEDGNYYFRWEMRLRFARAADGPEKRTFGMTHVRFDSAGRVVLHQDFWDATGGLFEQVPVLGWMLRRAKAKL